MLDLLIVADDLTGAIDTGIQFVKNGYKTLVTTDPLALSDCIDPTIRVLVVTTTSRHISPNRAYMRVYNAVVAAKSWGVGLFYKKTDSTLRGNIGAELAAMMQASGLRQMVFAPALPGLKRTVQNGKIYVCGKPLSESQFSKDPFSPVRSDYVPDIIGEQTNIPVHICSADNLPDFDEKDCILLLDAQSDQDMQEIAEKIRDSGCRVAFAGCSGFAAALPTLLPKPEEIIQQEKTSAERVLFVSGSINETSMAQVKMAEAEGVPVIRLPPEEYLMQDYLCSEAYKRLCRELEDAFLEAGCAVLYTARDSVQAAEATAVAKQINLETERLHLTIADCIGKVVSAILERMMIDVLVVFGGDTLQGILKSTGCSNVFPMTELLPGIVQSQTTMNDKKMVVVSKSGGFGPTDTILRVKHHFKQGWESRRLTDE